MRVWGFGFFGVWGILDLGLYKGLGCLGGSGVWDARVWGLGVVEGLGYRLDVRRLLVFRGLWFGWSGVYDIGSQLSSRAVAFGAWLGFHGSGTGLGGLRRSIRMFWETEALQNCLLRVLEARTWPLTHKH